MKKAVFIVCVFASLSFQKVYAQVLGVDGAGNSPIVYSGGSAGIDVLRGAFNASMLLEGNNLYEKKNNAFGLSLNRIERGGISNLLRDGSSASVSSIGITGAWVYSNEYKNKYKPKQEYEKLLMDEKQILERFIDIYKKDTVLVFMVIRSLPGKYDTFKDSLKQLFTFYGPTEKLFNNWVGYAQRVEDRVGEKGFAKEVMHLVVRIKSTLLYSNYANSIGLLEKINLQIKNIDFPTRPFERNILAFNVGIKNFSHQQANFIKVGNTKDTIPVFDYAKQSSAFISLSYNYQYNNKVFFGMSIGYDSYDNFETLRPVQYDTVKQFNTSGGQVVSSYNGYTGKYKNKGSAFFSARLTIVSDVPKMGKVLLTPVYFTFAARTTVGASVQLIARNGVSLSASAETFDLGALGNNNRTVLKYNNYSFGFTLGYTLVDLDFFSHK